MWSVPWKNQDNLKNVIDLTGFENLSGLKKEGRTLEALPFNFLK
jgi:hypothetical protein